MLQKMRIKLARWILGKHCSCYQMGYHNMVDFKNADSKISSNNKIIGIRDKSVFAYRFGISIFIVIFGGISVISWFLSKLNF